MSKYQEILKLAEYFLSLSGDKDNKLLYNELIKSDPEMLARVRQQNAERQRRFHQKHPEKAQDARKNQWQRMKVHKESGQLTGLIVKLRRQVAEAKYTINVKTNKSEEEKRIFIETSDKIYQFINDVVMYLKDNSSNIADLITSCQSIKALTGRYGAINNSIAAIENQLHEAFDITQEI